MVIAEKETGRMEGELLFFFLIEGGGGAGGVCNSLSPPGELLFAFAMLN